MKIVFNKDRKKVIFILILFITLFLTSLFSQSIFISNNFLEEKSSLDKYEELLFTQDSTNDTIAPIITFIQPSVNNSIITEDSYTIIAEIDDENPPVYGNVSVQISNSTNSLFTAKMNNTAGDLWSFNWNNISVYPDQKEYIFEVYAIDSSLNNNFNWSEGYYVFVNTSIGEGPPLLNLIFYFIAVAVIFGVIMVYLNKKGIYTSSKKRKEQEDSLLKEE